MILFLDSSSLIKLYIAEFGSEAVRRLVADSDAVAISRIGRLELSSSLARRGREGFLTAEDLHDVRTAFDADWSTFGIVDIDVDVAERLVEQHQLRAMDAIQLAALLWVATKVPSRDLCFGCHDIRLAEAARAEGFAVRP